MSNEINKINTDNFNFDEKIEKMKEEGKKKEISIEKLLNDKDRQEKYTEINEKLQEYYMLKKEDVFNKEFIEELGTQLVVWMSEKDVNYYLKSFFSEFFVSNSLVKRFVKNNIYFSECYNLALYMQEAKLVSDSLKQGSKIKANQAQFILMNAHDMTHKETKTDDDKSQKEKIQEFVKTLSNDEIKKILNIPLISS